MNKNIYRKTSLEELDDYIDEVIARNPEWVKEIERIVEENRNEQENTKPC